MFREFITWTEGEPARIRKIVLILIVTTWVITTIVFMFNYVCGKPIDGVNNYYLIVCGALTAAYGFYTGTSASKDSSNPVI